MEAMEHLTLHRLREAELVHWAEHVRQAQERLDADRPAPGTRPVTARRDGLTTHLRRLFGGGPAGRHA